MEKTSRIYVAGHCGLVGSAIVRKLQKEGYENLIKRTSSELDLCDTVAVKNFFQQERPDYVFLAAAKVGGIMANTTYPADFIRNNLQIQTNVIDSAYRNGATKLVFLGSSCIYPKHAPQPMREDFLLGGLLEPTNEWYAIAKIAGIKTCQAYRRQYGFNAISLMPTNLYGPNDNYDLEKSHVLPALIRKFHLAKLAQMDDMKGIMEDEKRHGKIPDDFLHNLGLARKADSLVQQNRSPISKITLWGSGSPYREFLHVDDLASAAVFLMQNYNEEEIVNVGVGEDSTIKDLAEMVKGIVGFKGEIVWDLTKPDGTPRKLMDVAKIKALGWNPTISLKEGITREYLGYKENSTSS